MEEPKLNIEDTITITYKGEIYSEEDLDVIYDILAEEYYENNEQNLRDDIDFKPKELLTKQKLKELKDWNTKIKASSWKSRQRSLRKKGRLEQYKIDSLNKLGMVWNPREDEWEKTYLLYRKFGLCDEIEEWVKEQRNLYKSKELPTDNLYRLQAVNFPFEAKENEEFKLTRTSVWALKEKLRKKKRRIELKLIKNPPKILTEKQQEIINKEIQDRKQRQPRKPRKPRKKNTTTKKGTYYSRRFNLKPDFDKNLINLTNEKLTEFINLIISGKSMYYDVSRAFFIEESDPILDQYRPNNIVKSDLENLKSEIDRPTIYEELSTFNRAKIDPEIRKIACNYMLNYFEDIVDNNLRSFPPLKYLISAYKKEKNIDQLLRLKKYVEQYPILNELYQDKIGQNLIKIKP